MVLFLEIGERGGIDPKIFCRMAEFVLHEGHPFFLYEDRKSTFYFGYWEDGKWFDHRPAGPPFIHRTDNASMCLESQIGTATNGYVRAAISEFGRASTAAGRGPWVE
jgi:hypothetical protein